ncbi:MAG: P-II family nitrogen regulator [Balneolales bacterium]
MKEIKAIIRPVMFETVYKNLRAAGYCCVTVYHGEGTGRHGDPDKLNAGLDFPFLHSKVVKIEIIIADKQKEEVFQIIQRSACTHHKGDGIIYSTTIDKAMSIRTGDGDEEIL